MQVYNIKKHKVCIVYTVQYIKLFSISIYILNYICNRKRGFDFKLRISNNNENSGH